MSETENKEVYIGPLKISSVVTADKLSTPLGGKILFVVYENGLQETIPQKTFDLIVSDKPSDWNDLQKRRFRPIIQDILGVLMEYDIKVDDSGALFVATVKELDNAVNRAVNLLWTGDDSLFVPGVNPMNERTLLESVQVVKNHAKKNESKKETGE